MKKDILDKLFDDLQGVFNTEEPDFGHQERFLEKLSANSDTKVTKFERRIWWKPLSIAAGIALLIAIGLYSIKSEPSIEARVAKISPEASNTQFYFTNLIEEQVKKLKDENAPETQRIIGDTLIQLENLEKDYTQLEENLLNGGNSKLILSAMITNFQTRIDLLNDVLDQIETIKNIKEYSDEKLSI